MVNARTGKCKCPSKKRYVSNGICNHSDCIDICTTPICGTPDNLTLLAPVVYDEIGINLCRTIPLPDIAADIATNNVVAASIQVIDVAFTTTGTDAVTIAQISGRPNCYLITLTNLTVTFAITLYNCSRQIISTVTETAVYLPPATSAEYTYFDEETNPSTVELELFAPYGIAYTAGDTASPLLNYIGFSSTNNMLVQGLNLIAIPKILNFDLSEPAVTVGISLYLKSVYFSQYLLPHNGRAIVPKGTLVPDDDTVCMDFVCGDLLDYDIKPLELGPPKYEGLMKEACGNVCGNEAGSICANCSGCGGCEDCSPITFATELAQPVEG